MKLSDRLAQVKGSRRVSSWERETGIARGNLDRAIKGAALSEENLRKLVRAENVSVDWLLEGRGTPYYIVKLNSDAEIAHALQAYFDDEAARWAVTIIRRKSADVPLAIALTMPIERKGPDDTDFIKESALELITGPIGPLSSQVLCRSGWNKVSGLALDDEIVADICNGQLGTYALLVDPGYLLLSTALDPQVLAVITAALNVSEAPNCYHVPLTFPEQALLQCYRALPVDDRQRLVVIAEALKESSLLK